MSILRRSKNGLFLSLCAIILLLSFTTTNAGRPDRISELALSRARALVQIVNNPDKEYDEDGATEITDENSLKTRIAEKISNALSDRNTAELSINRLKQMAQSTDPDLKGKAINAIASIIQLKGYFTNQEVEDIASELIKYLESIGQRSMQQATAAGIPVPTVNPASRNPDEEARMIRLRVGLGALLVGAGAAAVGYAMYHFYNSPAAPAAVGGQGTTLPTVSRAGRRRRTAPSTPPASPTATEERGTETRRILAFPPVPGAAPAATVQEAGVDEGSSERPLTPRHSALIVRPESLGSSKLPNLAQPADSPAPRRRRRFTEDDPEAQIEGAEPAAGTFESALAAAQDALPPLRDAATAAKAGFAVAGLADRAGQAIARGFFGPSPVEQAVAERAQPSSTEPPLPGSPAESPREGVMPRAMDGVGQYMPGARLAVEATRAGVAGLGIARHAVGRAVDAASRAVVRMVIPEQQIEDINPERYKHLVFYDEQGLRLEYPDAFGNVITLDENGLIIKLNAARQIIGRQGAPRAVEAIDQA